MNFVTDLCPGVCGGSGGEEEVGDKNTAQN